MDDRISWPQTEQLICTSYKHWLRLWETSTGKNGNFQPNSMVRHNSINNNRLEEQQDFVPLSDKAGETTNKGRTEENIASTKGLNHSSQLPNLERGRLIPWLVPGKEYHYNKVMCLHEEILDFYEWIKPTPDEQYMRQGVITKVTNVINRLWKDAVVETFGSFQTGLYLPTSDIDLVVFGRWSNIPLHTLAKALQDEGIAESRNIRVLDRAAVPIIKLVDKETDVKVDISFNQYTGLNGVKLIKELLRATEESWKAEQNQLSPISTDHINDYYELLRHVQGPVFRDFLQRFPNLKYLVLVLKQFLLQRDLNEVYTGGIGSYCLLYLIISFLQMHPRYDPRVPYTNLGVLLIEFFELYGCNFNFEKVGIVIRDGGRYVDKHQYSNSKKLVPGFLSIEDPMEPDNDIGKTSYGAFVVKQTFEYAYLVLRSMEARPILPGESILGRIVRVTDKVVDYRRWIKSKYPAPTPDLIPMRAPGTMVTVSVKQNTWAKVAATNSEGYSDGASECSEPNSSTSHGSSCTSSIASDEEDRDQPQIISTPRPKSVQSKKSNTTPHMPPLKNKNHKEATPDSDVNKRKETPSKRSVAHTAPTRNSNNSNTQRSNSKPRDLPPKLQNTIIVTNSSLTAKPTIPPVANPTIPPVANPTQAKSAKVALTKRRRTLNSRNNEQLMQTDLS